MLPFSHLPRIWAGPLPLGPRPVRFLSLHLQRIAALWVLGSYMLRCSISAEGQAAGRHCSPAHSRVQERFSSFLPLLRSRLADRAEQAAASRFLRFPGGCYVEGVTLANAFYWKPSVGPLDQRPGHWNGMWQYWSTDGG